VKQLCGSAKTTGRDLKSILHPDLVCEEVVLAERINQAFVNVMKDFLPLTDCVYVATEDDQPIFVTEQSVTRKLRTISTSRDSGPDDLPNWVLREFADILAPPIADILNTSFSECKVPCVWKLADVPPSTQSTFHLRLQQGPEANLADVNSLECCREFRH